MHKPRRDDNTTTTRESASEVITAVICTITMGVLFAWLLINWITGCGEIIHTYDGAIMGECVFMPWRD